MTYITSSQNEEEEMVESLNGGQLKRRPLSARDSYEGSQESLNTDTLSSARSNRYTYAPPDEDAESLDLPVGASALDRHSFLEEPGIKACKSEACLSPASPGQRRIALALASSLADHSTSTLPLNVHQTSPLSQSECDLSIMNTTLTAATTANRSFLKWRRRKKGSEVFSDLDVSSSTQIRKRPSIRESIRNLFIKKRLVEFNSQCTIFHSLLSTFVLFSFQKQQSS